jgi:hypothetical protein
MQMSLIFSRNKEKKKKKKRKGMTTAPVSRAGRSAAVAAAVHRVVPVLGAQHCVQRARLKIRKHCVRDWHRELQIVLKYICICFSKYHQRKWESKSRSSSHRRQI